MAKRLNRLGIDSVYELAQANPHLLQETFGMMGLQLYAHSWGLIVPFREKHHIKLKNHLGIVRFYREIMREEIRLN